MTARDWSPSGIRVRDTVSLGNAHGVVVRNLGVDLFSVQFAGAGCVTVCHAADLELTTPTVIVRLV